MKGKPIAFFIMAAALLSGCMGYGKLGPQVHPGDGPGVEDLLERWNDFEVTAVNDRLGRPAALLFDPRGDDRILTVTWGDRLRSPEEVRSVQRSIEQRKDRACRLYPVLGPDGASYGYALTTLHHLILGAVDGRTLSASAPALSDHQSGP